MVVRKEDFELRRDRDDATALVIRGEALVPREPRGAVVICHGFKGFARFAFFPYLAGELAEAGLTAVTFDFSGSGIGEDRENFTNADAFTHNTFLQELGDVEMVVAESRANGWIEGGYGVLGHSRGGGIAILHAARDPQVDALTTWAAISHPHRWPREVVRDWRQRGFMDVTNARTGQTIPLSTGLLDEIEEFGGTTLDITAAASRITAPWLIVHGRDDETVPWAEAEDLARAASGEVTLRIVDGANHTFGAKHPVTEPGELLRHVTAESVEFFVERLARA